MILSSLYLILGLTLLIISADRFIAAASALALNFGVSAFLVGLTIVAFGTSAPEIAVAVSAALKHNGGLALGNALGSNIANIALVLGSTVLIKPLRVSARVLKAEFPILFGIMLAMLLMMVTGHLSLIDGLIFLTILIVLIVLSIKLGLKQSKAHKESVAKAHLANYSNAKAITLLVISCIIITVSSYFVVEGGVGIAKYFGVSDIVIGVTIIALGTSLPEWATSMLGALKGQPDLAIGNVLGSNILNMLAVLSVVAIASPGQFDPILLYRDMSFMFLVTLALFAFSFTRNAASLLKRWQGACLLLLYISYMVVVYLSRTGMLQAH